MGGDLAHIALAAEGVNATNSKEALALAVLAKGKLRKSICKKIYFIIIILIFSSR